MEYDPASSKDNCHQDSREGERVNIAIKMPKRQEEEKKVPDNTIKVRNRGQECTSYTLQLILYLALSAVH